MVIHFQPFSVKVGNDVVGSAAMIPQRPSGIRKQVLQLVLVVQDCIQNHQSEDCSDNDDASGSGTSEEGCHVGMWSGRASKEHTMLQEIWRACCASNQARKRDLADALSLCRIVRGLSPWSI